MGLDMYLSAKRYASKYSNPDLAAKITKAVGEDAPPSPDNLGSVEVTMEAAYWRKANAIHAWFVRNVQDGQDDCGSYLVSREKLTELRDICRDVLTDRGEARAAELLPTQSGFFFGSTEYSDWYWQDIEETETKLSALIEWGEGRGSRWDFYYSSSW